MAVQLAVFGLYMGRSFAPNHIGMPLVPARLRLDFLRRQVLMSRNVSGGRPMAVLMGGLNYQVEHHLLPSMARPHLRHVQPLVEAHCAAVGVRYTQTTLWKSYGIVVRFLNTVGLRGRDPFRKRGHHSDWPQRALRSGSRLRSHHGTRHLHHGPGRHSPPRAPQTCLGCRVGRDQTRNRAPHAAFLTAAGRATVGCGPPLPWPRHSPEGRDPS